MCVLTIVLARFNNNNNNDEFILQSAQAEVQARAKLNTLK